MTSILLRRPITQNRSSPVRRTHAAKAELTYDFRRACPGGGNNPKIAGMSHEDRQRAGRLTAAMAELAFPRSTPPLPRN